VIGNFVLFQLAWFACVMTAARGQQWLGALIAAAVVGLFAWLAPQRVRALQLFALVTLVGTAWDSLVSATGWIQYAGWPELRWLAPPWIIAMWALFATLLNVSLRWLRGRVLLAALFGLVGAPLAYYGGVRLGAVQLPNALAALVLQAAGWAVLTPWLIRLGVRLEH
jgi:hypothetical protein